MIKISLVTPIRENLDDLSHLIHSLRETTHDKRQVELILIVDKCDKDIFPIIEEIKTINCDLNLRMYAVERSDHFSKDYFNYAAKKAVGRWIMAINDDSIFRTKSWDEIIINKMEAAAEIAGDDILFGIIDDGMKVRHAEAIKRTFSCWPLLSKEYCDLMDGILINDIYTWGGDFWLGQVFRYVQKGERCVRIPEVLVFHNSHHSNPSRPVEEHLPQPKSFKHFQDIEARHPANFDSRKANVLSQKINNYIKEIHG